MTQPPDLRLPELPAPERWPPLHPVTWLFALLPFQWIAVAGGLKLPYLALLVALVAVLAAPRALVGAAEVLRREVLWLTPYALYLVILVIALLGSPGQGIALRQGVFLSGFVVVAAGFAIARAPARLARWWGAATILAFLAGSEWIARSLGHSWAEAAARFVLAGDLDFVIYGFFREIFNATAGGEGAAVAASQKNMVAGTLLVALALFRAGHDRRGRDGAGLVVASVVIVVLIMLNSRTVLMTLALALVVAGLMKALSGQRFGAVGLMLRLFVAALAAVALVALFSSATALSDALGARFALDDNSAGARMDQYVWALQRIEQAFLTGSGYAELNGQMVHNLFLGAFMHAGVGAFLLVGLVYGVLLASWGSFVLRAVSQPGYWLLPLRPEWVAVLPMLPLVRMWVGGDAGHNSLVEWVALGAFQGLVAANGLRRAAARRQRGEPATGQLRGLIRR